MFPAHKELTLKQPSYSLHQPHLITAPSLPSQSFYQARNPSYYQQYSPQKMNHSFIAPGNQRNTVNQDFSIQRPSVQYLKCSQVNHKENYRNDNQNEGSILGFKTGELRLKQIESRIQRLERQEKKADLIAKSVEEVMKLQLRDIKFSQQIQERMNTIEEMITHIKSSKADRHEHEETITLSTSKFQSELQELWSKQQQTQHEVKQNRERLQRVINKIQGGLAAVGQKYEEFIESNIIKSVEQVNKLTFHYYEQIQVFRAQLGRINKRVQQNVKSVPLMDKLIAIGIPNLKIIQSIAIAGQRKTSKDYLINDRQSPKFSANWNVLNNLYDPLQKATTESSSIELQFQKTVYKLDRQFFLLDENQHYILDNQNQRIKLSQAHISAIIQHNLLE